MNPESPQKNSKTRFSWQGILLLVLAALSAFLLWQWIEKHVDGLFSLDASISINGKNDSLQNDSDTTKGENSSQKFIDTYYDGIARFRENGKYGYIRQDQKILVAATFDHVDVKFQEGMAWVKKGKKYGFISQEKWGEVAIPIEYDDVERFQNGFAHVKKGDKLGKVNKEGKAYGIDLPMKDILNDDYFRVTYEKIGEIIETTDGQFRVKARKRESLWGFLNEEGDLVVEAEYDQVRDFEGVLAWVCKDELCGMIDTEGNEVVAVIYEEVFPEKFIEGFMRVKKEGKYGFINQKGELVTPAIYEEAGLFKEGMAYVKKDGKYGFIDRTGEIAVETLYDEIVIYDQYYGFQKGRAKMRVGNRWGYVYRDGREWWFD